MKKAAVLLSLAALLTGSSAQALIYTAYLDRATFLGDLSVPVVTQDFSGYADNANMMGVAFLPGGVNVTTNADQLEIFPGDKDLFAFDDHTRSAEDLYYDIHVNNYYRGFGFDITAYNPDEGDGYISVLFANGDLVGGSWGAAGPTESDPTFFGIIADEFVSDIRWYEGIEGNGGNEETGLNNFVAGSPVPEPTTIFLLGMGLTGLGAAYRRRRRS